MKEIFLGICGIGMVIDLVLIAIKTKVGNKQKEDDPEQEEFLRNYRKSVEERRKGMQ